MLGGLTRFLFDGHASNRRGSGQSGTAEDDNKPLSESKGKKAQVEKKLFTLVRYLFLLFILALDSFASSPLLCSYLSLYPPSSYPTATPPPSFLSFSWCLPFLVNAWLFFL